MLSSQRRSQIMHQDISMSFVKKLTVVGVVIEVCSKIKVRTKGKREERALKCGEEQTSNLMVFFGYFCL